MGKDVVDRPLVRGGPRRNCTGDNPPVNSAIRRGASASNSASVQLRVRSPPFPQPFAHFRQRSPGATLQMTGHRQPSCPSIYQPGFESSLWSGPESSAPGEASLVIRSFC